MAGAPGSPGSPRPLVAWIGSPNRTVGRGGYRPEAVVIHIMEGELRAVDQWFNTTPPANPSPVSAHYGVGRGGAVHQYVHEMDSAWHAGRVYRPTWTRLRPGVNPNAYTIGIEHEGYRDTDWTDAMYDASASLLADISQRWSIALDREHVVGHREIYALKPFCPGHRVDLDHLLLLAHAIVLSGVRANLVDASARVTTRSALHVRRGAPSSLAQLVRTVPAGTVLTTTGWTSAGETVHGNPHWYRDADGNYLWAGGTDRPVPALAS